MTRHTALIVFGMLLTCGISFASSYTVLSVIYVGNPPFETPPGEADFQAVRYSDDSIAIRYFTPSTQVLDHANAIVEELLVESCDGASSWSHSPTTGIDLAEGWIVELPATASWCSFTISFPGDILAQPANQSPYPVELSEITITDSGGLPSTLVVTMEPRS